MGHHNMKFLDTSMQADWSKYTRIAVLSAGGFQVLHALDEHVMIMPSLQGILFCQCPIIVIWS